ncbi:hypothetical protein J2W46_003564 [Paraburkholderia strydomiana]|nr:hypothetical protein [Paraburkholderia strydomiana]
MGKWLASGALGNGAAVWDGHIGAEHCHWSFNGTGLELWWINRSTSGDFNCVGLGIVAGSGLA